MNGQTNNPLKNSENNVPPQIPELSTHYYKSRNSLLLFSGLLLAWELIGVTIKEADTSGFKFTIENIDAIPYVFLLLIVYFTFRIFIEWFQSDRKRRTQTQSKIDFIVSLSIPLLAIILYLLQLFFGISIFSRYSFWIIAFTLIATIITAFVSYKNYMSINEARGKAVRLLTPFLKDYNRLNDNIYLAEDEQEKADLKSQFNSIVEKTKKEVNDSEKIDKKVKKQALKYITSLSVNFENQILADIHFEDNQINDGIEFEERKQKGIP